MQPTRVVKYLVVWTTILLGFLAIPSISAPISSGASCVQITWQYIIIFYGANYLAHAGTVPTPAGAKWDFALHWSLAAFFLPYVGLGRSVALIYRHFAWGKNELDQALASNALVVLARGKGWIPLEGEKWPENFSETLKAEDPYAHGRGARTIYGKMELPDEESYRWIMLSPERAADITSYTWNDFCNFRLSKSQSWLKMALSVAQLVYSCISIYRTRGSQIDQYGYAAYGLSVIPYTFMSLANFICAALVGQYPCVYALTSPVMEEAKARRGRFVGAIDVQWKSNSSNGSVKTSTSSSTARKPISVIRTLIKIVISGVLVLVVQYILLYFLTKFEKKHSTVAQRAWMMGWASANQFAFFPLACISTLWPQFLNLNKNRMILSGVFLPLGVASIGGLVQVGMMMKSLGQSELC